MCTEPRGCRVRSLLVLFAVTTVTACGRPSEPTARTEPTNPNEEAVRQANAVIGALGAMTVLEGNAAAGDHACSGGGVTLRTDGKRVNLTGDCATVVIEGNNNRVHIGRVAALTVRGDGNEVSYSRESSPIVSNVGNNVVGARD